LPNHVVLNDKLAAIEGAEAGLVTASGMAAISMALLSVLRQGDHLLVQDCLYGGTFSLMMHDLADLGISHDAIDASDPASWEEHVRPNTRAIYVESITNPLMQVIDHRAVVALANKRNLVSLIDNTFATPVNFRPIQHGYDLSLHSATKYLNGHSDLAAGAVIGSRERVDAVHARLNHFGGSLDPRVCYLLYRGMRTLALRVRHQNASALRLARFFESRAEVEAVNYPGLESHPQHAMAADLFDGFGGMLSFELGGDRAARERFFDKLQLPIRGPSLGGVETLLTEPVRTSHSGLSPTEREAMGIRDNLIRVSTGIEATDDLIADFAQALDAAFAGAIKTQA